jgi:hypothetical protein
MLPSVYRREEALSRLSRRYAHASDGERGWPPPGSEARRLLDLMTLADDCFVSALLLEAPAATATRLMGLVLASVHAALCTEGGDAAKAAAAAAVPEALVRSVIHLASFVIKAGAPDLFGASRGLGASMEVRFHGFISVLSRTDYPAVVVRLGADGSASCMKPCIGKTLSHRRKPLAGAVRDPARPHGDLRDGARLNCRAAARDARGRGPQQSRRRFACAAALAAWRRRARRERLRGRVIRRRHSRAHGHV